MHLHILGICGTFMGGIAAIARRAGHTVTGCDANVYPPMSTQLGALGIALTEGFDAAQLDGVAKDADAFIVGNVVSRGNALMEALMNANRAYVSGPQWLYENVLRDRFVLAVAGTHGKTTTSAMLAHILEQAGLAPSFLIGGVAVDFGISARLTDSAFFVIEADEYDTAFFDKRSKFVHYRPRAAILNNLEFDHADIFADLGAIETQFHHFVRTIPGDGCIVANGGDDALARVLARGAWSAVERFDEAPSQATPPAEWTIAGDGRVAFCGEPTGTLAANLDERRSTRRASLSARSRCGTNCRPCPQVAASNEPDGNESSSMSISSKRAFGTASERATSIIPGARSTPTTSPPGATAAASRRARLPGPHARSRMRIPGRASTRSSTRCRPRASPLDMSWSSRRSYACAWRLKIDGYRSFDFTATPLPARRPRAARRRWCARPPGSRPAGRRPERARRQPVDASC